MKEIHELKAEIFRRSEKMKDDRRKTISRTLAVCLPIILLVTLTTATVFAVVKGNEKPEDETAVTTNRWDYDFIREEASGEVIITLADGTHIPISYEGSNEGIDGGGYVDVYMDKDGYEYFFNADGKLTTIALDSNKWFLLERDLKKKVIKNGLGSLTEDAATTIMMDYGRKVFGDLIDEFDFDYIRKGTGYYSNFVALCKHYGDGGFVRGECIDAEILFDGTVVCCWFSSLWLFEDFDPSSLDGITQEDVYTYAIDWVKKEYGEEIIYEPKYVDLKKENGEYMLRVKGTLIDNSLDYEERERTVDVIYDLP